MTSQPRVALRAVGKRFGGVEALRDVSLVFERGEVHGLVGENGAGKSTLGKVIAGALQPETGGLLLDGREVRYGSPRDALAGGVTLIAQERLLVHTRSVLENVFLGVESARWSVVNRRRLRARYAALCERTGFDVPPRARVSTLRAADQQKVEILRALAREADVVVMDEPTAGLARNEAADVLRIVQLLKSQGATVVYVSHTLEEVLAVSDTVSVLRDGEVVRTAPAEMESVGSLVTAMLGRSLSVSSRAKPDVAADAPVVLSVRGLTRDGGVTDVSFDVRAGEIVGITGLIGSGRSQVARLVSGAENLDAGTVTLDGEPLRLRSPRDAIRRGIVLLPESREAEGLMLQRSIVENITLPHLRAVSRGGVLRRRREAADAAEVTRKLDVRANDAGARLATLSGGNQQKVLLAKWLFRPPRVLIADEPTRGVDIGAKNAVYELVDSFARAGMSVVLVSSEVKEVLGLSHRVLVMREGRVVRELDGRVAREDEVMRAALGDDPTSGPA